MNTNQNDNFEYVRMNELQMSRRPHHHVTDSVDYRQGLARNLSHENLHKTSPTKNKYINFDLTQEQYNSLVKKQQKAKFKSINLSNHQIYLPPGPTITIKDQIEQSAMLSDSEDVISESRSPAPTLIHGSICNCVNIASCSKDKINGFIHSKDCQLINQCKSVPKLNRSNSEFEIQRKHF